MKHLPLTIDANHLSNKIRMPLTTIMGTAELLHSEVPLHFKPQINNILLAGNELTAVADCLVNHSVNVKDKVCNYPYRILLIEDDLIARHVHYKMLEHLGCHVEVAENGENAVAKVDDTYDVIFMDLGLPDIDGYEVTTKIRNLKSSAATIPIIVLTAFPLSLVEEKCFEVGANAVFNKPIKLEILNTILKDFIRSEDKKIKN